MLASVLVAVTLCASGTDSVRVSPGTQELLKHPGLTRVAIGDPAVADVRVTGAGEVLVLGRQPGRTSLTLWAGSKVSVKTVVVDDGRSSEIARLVKDNVSPTLRVTQYNSATVIEGTLDSVEELDRLKLLIGNDPTVKLLVKMNPYALPFLASQITQAFEKNGIKSAKAIAVGDRIFLEGSVADTAEMTKATAIADAIYSTSQGTLHAQ